MNAPATIKGGGAEVSSKTVPLVEVYPPGVPLRARGCYSHLSQAREKGLINTGPRTGFSKTGKALNRTTTLEVTRLKEKQTPEVGMGPLSRHCVL